MPRKGKLSGESAEEATILLVLHQTLLALCLSATLAVFTMMPWLKGAYEMPTLLEATTKKRRHISIDV